MSTPTPIVLSIAGSDSSGGAGTQADIKAISATGGYACTVITATTAQNTQGVTDIHPIPVAHIETQLDAIFSDLDVQAVKIGMLADTAVISLVAKKLQQYHAKHIVLDPVMVASSGHLLLQENAISTLKQELIPLVSLLTPNLPEAAALLEIDEPNSEEQIQALFPLLKALPSEAVLLKGGHHSDSKDSTDWLIQQEHITSYSAPRIATRNTHGTGCTLSSAIASYLAQGDDLNIAVARAKEYITQAISNADQLNVGHGHGPLQHFFHLNF